MCTRGKRLKDFNYSSLDKLSRVHQNHSKPSRFVASYYESLKAAVSSPATILPKEVQTRKPCSRTIEGINRTARLSLAQSGHSVLGGTGPWKPAKSRLNRTDSLVVKLSQLPCIFDRQD